MTFFTMTHAPSSDTRRLALRGALALLGAFTLAACGADAAKTPLSLSLEEGRDLFEARQVLLIDIREPREHASGVVSGALLLPASQFKYRMAEIPKDPAQPVLIICNTQNRSRILVRTMQQAGWSNVRYVRGGMSTWARQGWPMVRPGAQTSS